MTPKEDDLALETGAPVGTIMCVAKYYQPYVTDDFLVRVTGHARGKFSPNPIIIATVVQGHGLAGGPWCDIALNSEQRFATDRLTVMLDPPPHLTTGTPNRSFL